MFEVGEMVLYGTEGICKIEKIAPQTVAGEKTDYYILKPIYDKHSTFYIPVNSPKTPKRLRKVLQPDELLSVIHKMPSRDLIWIEDEAERKKSYSEMIANGDRSDLIGIIKTLYVRKKLQNERGRQLHASDEQFFRDAEKILYDEFAQVLDIDREQVLPFIIDLIDGQSKDLDFPDGDE